MATAEKQKKVLTVGSLKKFLENIPDSMPIRGNFSTDRVTAYLWKADPRESGPRRYVEFEQDDS